MDYTEEEKRSIIIDNYNEPEFHLNPEHFRQKQFSDNNFVFASARSLETGCGDVFNIVVNLDKKLTIKECFFLADESCLLTVSFANILCSLITKRTKKYCLEIVEECKKMFSGVKFDEIKLGKLVIFEDIINFPHRLECIKIVISAFEETLLTNR